MNWQFLISLVSATYSMSLTEIQRMTMLQFNAYLMNIEYVIQDSKNFGKPPPVELPRLAITEYAARCGVIVPRAIHIDLIKKGELP